MQLGITPDQAYTKKQLVHFNTKISQGAVVKIVVGLISNNLSKGHFMSVFAATNRTSKVHHSQYIHTENQPDESGTKPTEPVNPAAPEAK